MGSCLARLPHSCGTSGGLQVFEGEGGKVNGYCFSCSTYVNNPYGEERSVEDLPKKKLGLSTAEVAERISEISKLGSMDLRDRRLRKDCLDQFGIKIGLSEEDGVTPAFHHYPYTKDGVLVSYKTRLIEGKRMWSVGDQSDVDLFGWEQAIATGARKLIIVEGECDAAALWKILQLYQDPKFDDFTPAVCSLPHGSNSTGKDLARLAPKIRRHFKEISFAFDNDDAGALAVEAGCKVFPEATVISLPAKDANECIKTCGKAAFKAATFNAKKPKNTRLVSGDTLFEEAKKPAEFGVSWPWDGFTKLTRGIRTGETYYFAGPEKSGKSEIVSDITSHLIKEHNWQVMLAKPEEAPARTIKGVAGKIAKRIFHDPDKEFDEVAYDKACEVMRGKLHLVDVYQNVTWETLRTDIIAAASIGCKAAVIDPITCLTNGMSSGERNDRLMEIAQDLAVLALDLDIVIFIFCHLNKCPKGVTPFDRGGRITTDYFAGSSAMARSCHMAVAIHCNKDPELSEEERNMRELTILADRTFGVSASIKLFWNKANGAFNEVNVH